MRATLATMLLICKTTGLHNAETMPSIIHSLTVHTARGLLSCRSVVDEAQEIAEKVLGSGTPGCCSLYSVWQHDCSVSWN